MRRIAHTHAFRWLALPLALALVGGTAAFICSQPKRDVTTHSAAAYEAYQEGVRSLRKVRSAEAQRWFQKAVELDSTFAMAWMRLGRVQYSFHNNTDSRLSYEKALARIDRVKPREQYFIRMLGVDLGQDEKAREAFMDEMVARFPDDSEVLMHYATRAFFAGQHRKALDAYRRLVLRDPSMGDSYNMIGYACSELGLWDEAVEAFQKYAFLYPEQSNPHDSLGELYLRIGRYDDAVRECGKAAAITPDFAWAHIHAASALCDEGRFDEAVAKIRTGMRAIAADDPDRWNLVNQLINMQLLATNDDSVIALCRQRAAEDPADPALPFFLGRLHAARGETALARAKLAEFLEVDHAWRVKEKRTSMVEADFMVHELRGAIAASEGNWSEAADHFSRGLGRTPNWWINRRIQVERLEAMVRAGRLPESAAFADTLERVNPREPRLLGVMAELRAAEGRAPEASRLEQEAGAWSRSRLLLAAK